MSSTYLIALGSNRRHHLYRRPREVVSAAMEECAVLGTVSARSSILSTTPMGAAKRRFANAACMIESEFDPPALLTGLKRIEREFGRRTFRRWGDRVLDLDIVLWSEGSFEARDLSIPHREYSKREFVLAPAMQIAPDWRDPLTGKTIRQLYHRLRKT